MEKAALAVLLLSALICVANLPGLVAVGCCDPTCSQSRVSAILHPLGQCWRCAVLVSGANQSGLEVCHDWRSWHACRTAAKTTNLVFCLVASSTNASRPETESLSNTATLPGGVRASSQAGAAVQAARSATLVCLATFVLDLPAFADAWYVADISLNSGLWHHISGRPLGNGWYCRTLLLGVLLAALRTPHPCSQTAFSGLFTVVG